MTYIPPVDIKPYEAEYREQVKNLVMNLKKYYPDIEKWWEGKEAAKIDNGTDYCLMVLGADNDVVGVAISGVEREGVAKLKTFYLSDEISGKSLGVKLLKNVLDYWMGKRVRTIFVTFAEEELEELRGFFDKFGFLMDGPAPQFYRAGKTEYMMSKAFVYDSINEGQFEDFVRNYFLKMRGLHPESEGSEFVATEDTGVSKTPRRVFVKIVNDKTIDGKKLFEHVLQRIKETNSTYSLVFTYYPLLEQELGEKIKVVDGFMLENMFYPMRLRRSGYSGVILPIREWYAEKLMEPDEPQKQIMQRRLQITHEKHYLGGRIDEIDGATRGWTFLFYQTKGSTPGNEGIIGEAKIKYVTIEAPAGIIQKYGLTKSAFETEEELMKHSNKGKICLFLLTCVKTYPRRLHLAEIRNIIPDIDFRCQLITDEQVDKIRKLAGNDLNSY